MKKIYKVSKCEIEYYHTFIEAENEEKATQIAIENDVHWRNNHNYEMEITESIEAEEDELVGKLIENDNGGVFSYKK